jgi:tRNA (cmo5U34)-methyltransferase
MEQKLRELEQIKPWEFNKEVALGFVEHARRHIPGYDRVINKSVDTCRDRLPSNARILDVGCATGKTLSNLKSAGFTNLSGVDSSQAMLDQCHVSADLYCSTQLPAGPWDAVLCNWTMHFINDKKHYLQSVQDSLSDQGFLILSDKTSLDPIPVQQYHNFKRRNGTSEQEILEKQQQVRDIMYINDPLWYLNTLTQVGFNNIYIIDADWCFTTFFCTK